MFNLFKRKSKAEVPPSEVEQGLSKTRSRFRSGLERLFLGKKTLDEATLEALETLLLSSDLGIETTRSILAQLTDQIERKSLHDTDAALQYLRLLMINILEPYEAPLPIDSQQNPFVILTLGINGAGKTTSLGKIAHWLKGQGHRPLMAAGDTYRAAAIEQLQTWGKRNDIPVVAQPQGSDSASVIFDAMESAKAKNYNIVLADTAGRLHTQDHLMAELGKIKRVMQKFSPEAPHEVLLVIDGSIGQNSLQQAKQFNALIPITGIIVTKLDGTAKGGMIFSLTEALKCPIRFIGVGESISSLKPFVAKEFVDALFYDQDSN